MDDTNVRLLEQLIDLKIERAVTAIMADLRKLAEAHNHLVQQELPRLEATIARLAPPGRPDDR